MPTVQTNGIRTYYEEYGTGPPVVCLHGRGNDHRLWAEQARPLADDYRVIVYDLRGHGRTGGSEVDSYTMELYVEDLAAFVAALDLDRPAVCGLSMGGMIAQTFAARRPDGLAALATLSAVSPEILTRRDWFERRVVLKLAVGVSTVVGLDRVVAALRWVDERRREEDASGDLDALERIQRGHAEDYPEVSATESEKVLAALTSYPSTSVDLSSITAPSLLMYAEREPETVASHAKYMARRIPDAKARMIPDAGHHSHVDNPEFVVESLRGLLATARPGRSDESSG